MITLAEYYKKNKFIPTTFDILSDERLEVHRRKRENLYVNKLSIPNLVWRGAKVLEVGCSSGENSLLYAQMGAKLTFIEPLEYSVDRLKALFRHYNVEHAIENVYVDTVENVTLKESYEIIVAEGFLNTLERRDEIIGSLYQNLAVGGLLIISTNDAVGTFVECVKAALAQLYCRERGLDGIDEKVDAIRPFFEADYERIPHSRDFSLWAKDVLLNPVITSDPFYDFDEIVEDIGDPGPEYYSSWPSYRPSNDLVWHKYIPNKAEELDKIVRGYRLRRPSFLLGQVVEDAEGMRFLLENQDERITPGVKNIITAVKAQLYEGCSGGIAEAVRQAMQLCTGGGDVHQLFAEILENLKNLNPQTYRDSPLLRGYWGVPCHYIVFRK